jgi:hypothetical protein
VILVLRKHGDFSATYMYILSDIYVISVVEMLKCLNDHIYGVMLSMPSSSMVDSGFESRSVLTKYCKTGIRCFFLFVF